MAQKRMFSKLIISTDAFLDMPASTQLLYFHLNMEADDDGFVSSPKKVMRLLGSTEDDFKILIGKRFILPFESGICVIKHWLIHNYIRKDTYIETKYTQEKKALLTKDNGSYTEAVDEPSTQYRLGKDRIDKISLRESTPAEEAKEFFTDTGMQLRIFNEVCEPGNPYRELVGKEIAKFVEYWTELNKSGTKQRWEQEPTFEIKRRLKKWLSNVKQYSQNKLTNAAQI
jgi:hypothetical protein